MNHNNRVHVGFVQYMSNSHGTVFEYPPTVDLYLVTGIGLKYIHLLETCTVHVHAAVIQNRFEYNRWLKTMQDNHEHDDASKASSDGCLRNR